MFDVELTAQLIDAGQLEQATALCRAGMQADPQHALPYLMLSLVARAQGAVADQQFYLERAAGLSPQLPDTFLLLAQVYFAQERYRDSVLMLVAALQLNPNHAEALATLLLQWQQLGPGRIPLDIFAEQVYAFAGKTFAVAAPANPQLRQWMADTRQALAIAPPPVQSSLDGVFVALFWQALHQQGVLTCDQPAARQVFPPAVYQAMVFDADFALASRSDVLLRLVGEEVPGWIAMVYRHYLLPTFGEALQRADQTIAFQLAFWAFVSQGSHPHTMAQWQSVAEDLAAPLQQALPAFRALVAPNSRRALPKTPPRHFGFITELSITVSSGDLVMGDLMRALAAVPGVTVTLYVTEYWSVPIDDYLNSLRAVGVQVRHLIDIAEGVPLTDFLPRSRALQRAFAVDQIDTLIFVGVSEPKALFLGACGLAPRQIFFTLGFPYVTLPAEDWDGYMSGSRVQPGWPESRWWPYPPYRSDPSLDPAYPQRLSQAAEIRKFLLEVGDVILGCIARADKLRNPDFVDVLQAVLQRHPRAVFVWCGAAVEDPVVRQLLEERGIADRCLFAGWVDGQVYANVLDIHLDVFPFPSGLSMMETMSAGRAFAWYDGGSMSQTMSAWATTWRPVATGELGNQQDHAFALVAFIDPVTGVSLAPIAASKEAYVDNICYLIDNPERRAVLGLAARQFMLRTVHRPEFAINAFLQFAAQC